MANSLLTGFSGLQTHQRMIEVVGNNLANLNTTAFKSQRAAFSDVFYETLKGGSGGAAGIIGGSNPAQVGNGSKLASVAINFNQGGLDSTGSELDFAIDGEGFFVVNAPDGPQYTRAGAFGIDNDGFLVDSSTGYHVQRFGTTGEVSSLGPAFQSPGSASIRLPIGASVPGTATAVGNLRGNLSPSSLAATTQLLSTGVPLTAGGNPAVGTDLLNSLDIVSTAYAVGDSIEISGTDGLGQPFSATIAVDDTTTLQGLVDGLTAQIPGGTASIGADGKLQVESDTSGPSLLSVRLNDAAGNAGSADYASNTLVAVASGLAGDVVRASLEVFDEQGKPHVVGLELRPQLDGTWELQASLDPTEGTLLDSRIEGIRLNSNGSFQSAGVAGVGDQNLVFQFNSGGPQTVRINFGDPGSFTALTSIAVASSLATEQDGFSTGSIVGVNIDESGVIEGILSNGRRFDLAEIAVAMFRNPQGLETQGGNLYRSTTSSGTVELGAARSTGRGEILSGQLEQSNVDIAVEFTRLIIAQRGFSANARTITVADEILEELTNLIR
jgi:flagellar hook protein FlgE